MVVNEAPSTDRDTQARSLTRDTDAADVGLAIMEEAKAQEMRRLRDRASSLMVRLYVGAVISGFEPAFDLWCPMRCETSLVFELTLD
eukprot:43738-Eustigmatos_ZCMA.PRE.1